MAEPAVLLASLLLLNLVPTTLHYVFCDAVSLIVCADYCYQVIITLDNSWKLLLVVLPLMFLVRVVLVVAVVVAIVVVSTMIVVSEAVVAASGTVESTTVSGMEGCPNYITIIQIHT